MLGDLDITKKERKRRAKGLRIMGEIYEKVGSKEYKRQIKEEEKKRKEDAPEDKGKEKAADDDAGSSKDDDKEKIAEPPVPTTEDID